jgi:hypothetical protein
MPGAERERRAAVRNLVNDIATEGMMQLLSAPAEMSSVGLFGEGGGTGGGEAGDGESFEAAFERAMTALGPNALGEDFESAFEAASSNLQRGNDVRSFAAEYTGIMLDVAKDRVEDVDELQLDKAWNILADNHHHTVEEARKQARAELNETDGLVDALALNLVWELMHHDHAGIPAYLDMHDHTHDHRGTRALRMSDFAASSATASESSSSSTSSAAAATAAALERATKAEQAEQRRRDGVSFNIKVSKAEAVQGQGGGLGLEIDDSLVIIRTLPGARIAADGEVHARFLPLLYGDRIVAANGADVRGVKVASKLAKLADSLGDVIRFTIIRGGNGVNGGTLPVPWGGLAGRSSSAMAAAAAAAASSSKSASSDFMRHQWEAAEALVSDLLWSAPPASSPSPHRYLRRDTRDSDDMPWASSAAAGGVLGMTVYNAVPGEADPLEMGAAGGNGRAGVRGRAGAGEEEKMGGTRAPLEREGAFCSPSRGAGDGGGKAGVEPGSVQGAIGGE